MWGVQTGDIVAFDPIVNLLLGACAVELEKVYNDLSGSNARVLERLSKLLLPDVSKSTLPAHGILHASPYDGHMTLKEHSQFVFSKRVQAKESSIRENNVDVHFTPISDFPLLNASVMFIGTNTGLYKTENLIYKENAVKCSRNKVNTKFLWIGIQLKSPIERGDILAFYFDWLGNPLREKYLDFISFTKWFIHNNPVTFQQGIPQPEAENASESAFNYDAEFVEKQKIDNFYRRRFCYFSGDAVIDAGDKGAVFRKYPEEFQYLYDDQGLKQLKDELLWIKIVFPPFVSDDVVDSLMCQINCFPVFNRKLNEITFRLYGSDTLNILPLMDRNDNTPFFSMEGVKSTDGLPYISSNLAELNELNHGSYVIRKGGVERFDQRNAKEFLSYMIDLLRDESASFAAFEKDLLSNDLKQLNQKLAVIEQKIQRTDDNSATVDYLILRSYENQDNVFIEYWSTSGEFANDIKAGSKFNLYSGSDVDTSDLILISESTGGRNELTSAEILQQFKKAVSTRERIVTISDIRQVCFSEVGSMIRDVVVTKSYKVDSGSRTGFKRVIIIELIPASQITIDEDWEVHKLRLLNLIQNSSFSDLPVQIIVAGSN